MKCTCKYNQAKKFIPESALIHNKNCPMSKKINLEHRKKVQLIAIRLGYCPLGKGNGIVCPCKWFSNIKECHYAGEGNVTKKGLKDWIKYNTSDNS